MRTCPGLWRRAFARALFIATSLTGTPAAACPALSVEDLADRLPEAKRFELDAPMLPPFLALWRQHRAVDLPERPDGIALFARKDKPLLVAFRRAGCLVGLLPTEPDELWRAMRQHIGPIA
jgi:hypothetical protein